MASLLLYSTNVQIIHEICRDYRQDTYRVWCCEHFDPSRHPGSNIPPSSSPAEIYRDLQYAVNRLDSHNAKINELRATIKRLINKWVKNEELSKPIRDEVLFRLKNGGFDIWQPLLYIIPRNGLNPARIELVPAHKRAGQGNEFIIEDLKGSEFDVIEWRG